MTFQPSLVTERHFDSVNSALLGVTRHQVSWTPKKNAQEAGKKVELSIFGHSELIGNVVRQRTKRLSSKRPKKAAFDAMFRPFAVS